MNTLSQTGLLFFTVNTECVCCATFHPYLASFVSYGSIPRLVVSKERHTTTYSCLFAFRMSFLFQAGSNPNGFVWRDGTPFDYIEGWDANEPDARGGEARAEDCVGFRHGEISYGWLDFGCDFSGGFVCGKFDVYER